MKKNQTGKKSNTLTTTAQNAEKASQKKKSKQKPAQPADPQLTQPIEQRVAILEASVDGIAKALQDKVFPVFEILDKAQKKQMEAGASTPNPEGFPPAPDTLPQASNMDVLGTIAKAVEKIFSSPEPAKPSFMDEAVMKEIVEATRDSIKKRLGLADILLDQLVKGKLKIEFEPGKEIE